MKIKTLTGVVALALATLAPAVQAEDQPWLLRVRAVNLDSANKDSTGLDLNVNDKVIPEFDVSYFFTPNLAAELVLTYPQKHKVRSGDTRIGSLKHLPPTLLLQYHFDAPAGFKPYLGAGINYTRFSSIDLPAGVSIDKNSVGLALQAGVDYALSKNLYLNLDLKKVQIRTDVSAAGDKLGRLKVDPLLLGIGIGMRF